MYLIISIIKLTTANRPNKKLKNRPKKPTVKSWLYAIFSTKSMHSKINCGKPFSAFLCHMLFRICSIPHLIEICSRIPYPSKLREIGRLIRKAPRRIVIGCSLIAYVIYEPFIRENFPLHFLFTVWGGVPFKRH